MQSEMYICLAVGTRTELCMMAVGQHQPTSCRPVTVLNARHLFRCKSNNVLDAGTKSAGKPVSCVCRTGAIVANAKAHGQVTGDFLQC